MILGEHAVTDTEYLPFALGVAARQALRRRSRPAARQLTVAERRATHNGRLPNDCTFRKTGHRWRKSSAHWWNWPCAARMRNQTHAARLLDIAADALRYKLKKFELVGAAEEESADSIAAED